MSEPSDRYLAAKLARQLYSDEITYVEFVNNYPEEANDTEIGKLFDLIEHEPKVGGILGVSKPKRESHIVEIKELIVRLEK